MSNLVYAADDTSGLAVQRVVDPLPVMVDGLVATRLPDGGVLVEWGIAAGADAAGCRVERATVREGVFRVLGGGLVTATDGRYRFVDRSALPGEEYRYRLRVVLPPGGADVAGGHYPRAALTARLRPSGASRGARRLGR